MSDSELDPVPFPRETEGEEEHRGVKKGETISCCMCNKEIFRARMDVPYRADLKSEYLEFMDGEPVPFQAKMACPNCWIMFRSISTETRKTII